MQADLSGKVALVTGATKDIGKVVALKLAENGADVVINGRDAERGLKVVEQIKAMGRKAIFEKADIYKYPEVRQMVLNVIGKLGKIDILVASGGASARPDGWVPGHQFFRDIAPERYIDFAMSHWLSRANCVRAVLDHMIERQSGRIILITADSGRVATPRESMNGAGAAATMLMARALASEFTRWGIRVNCLSLTVTETESYKEARGTPLGQVLKKIEQAIPFGITKPDDVAEAALFFASEESKQITGQVLSINGGLSSSG